MRTSHDLRKLLDAMLMRAVAVASQYVSCFHVRSRVLETSSMQYPQPQALHRVPRLVRYHLPQPADKLLSQGCSSRFNYGTMRQSL